MYFHGVKVKITFNMYIKFDRKSDNKAYRFMGDESQILPHIKCT